MVDSIGLHARPSDGDGHLHGVNSPEGAGREGDEVAAGGLLVRIPQSIVAAECLGSGAVGQHGRGLLACCTDDACHDSNDDE